MSARTHGAMSSKPAYLENVVRKDRRFVIHPRTEESEHLYIARVPYRGMFSLSHSASEGAKVAVQGFFHRYGLSDQDPLFAAPLKAFLFPACV
jgi:hypothetical protein